jgi:hypothetical protein
MHFGANNQHYPYYMNGESLQETREERDIAVRASSSLKSAAQCSTASQTVSVVLGQLSRSFHYRDRYSFIGLYTPSCLNKILSGMTMSTKGNDSTWQENVK